MHRDHRDDPNARPPLVPVSAAKQREALRFVCDEILSGKYFDFGADLLRKAAPDFWADDFFSLFLGGHGFPYADQVLRVQYSLVYGLTSPDRLGRVLDARHKTPLGQDLLTAPDIFDAIHATVFGNLGAVVSRKSSNQAPAIDDLKRNLQREYVTHLIGILLEGEDWYPASIQTLARHYVKELAGEIGDSLGLDSAAGLDTYTRAHLEECQVRLERALEASYSLIK